MRTISRHAASTKRASLLFAVVLIGCGSLFYVWLLRWFVPHLQLGVLFEIVLTLAILGQIITALAPDIEGLSRTVHHYAAYTMAILFMPLAWLIFTAPHISAPARLFVGIAGFYLISSFTTVVILGKLRRYFLPFQASYIIVFQCAILVAAYA
ncbi:hypothetical protein JNM87_06795 [Candidatus Saccharibacteria bacterium]|nr:hypothetical protein [Candidatus Saccharibacteria bacterium]